MSVVGTANIDKINKYYILVDTGIIIRVLRIIRRISTRKTKMTVVKRNHRVPINFISINRRLAVCRLLHVYNDTSNIKVFDVSPY